MRGDVGARRVPVTNPSNSPARIPRHAEACLNPTTESATSATPTMPKTYGSSKVVLREPKSEELNETEGTLVPRGRGIWTRGPTYATSSMDAQLTASPRTSPHLKPTLRSLSER